MSVSRTAEPTERERQFEQVWDSPKGLIGFFSTINNIPVARRYMVAGFVFFIVGGLLALLMRLQLGSPENTFLDAETYNQVFTMHGTTMMFLFVIPFIEALANYLLPLLLGTRDMPFPRLTAFSFWTYVFGGIFIYSSFLWGLAPDGGWFAYVPLNNREFAPGLNMDFWDIGLSVAEIAAMGAAAELIVAILRMRAPGMRLGRMPLFAWSMLVTAFMIIFAFTPLIVGTAMLELDRKGLTSFFVPAVGGDPLLWQHLFWVFGHPEVYIMFVPAVGIISHVVQVFARRPQVSYALMVLSIIATGFLSFGLWVHHMFATNRSMVAMSFFTAASLVIAIPNGIQMIGWIATLWSGRPVWRTPLLFAVGFMVIFLIGGMSGVLLASVPVDLQAHDTHFVVAHFHYVLIGGVVFPLFAGLYYWLPKITGRLLSERLGRWNFWVMFVFFNVAFFPMHISGLLGMPRRVYTYPEGLGWETPNLISTIGAFGFAVGILLFVINVWRSRSHGALAGDNPWGADTLEWTESSPPPNAQFQYVPVVRHRHPLWDQTSLSAEGTPWAGVLEPLQSGPTQWRGALVVDVVDAEPRAIVHIPKDTLVPFTMAVGFVFVFTAALIDSLAVFLVGAAICAAATVGWYWPQRTEAIAIAEIGPRPGPGRLPLAVAGPMASGYWGTLVLVLILATAFATVLAGYYYLSDGPTTWPPPREFPAGRLASVVLPSIAAVLLVLLGGAAWWLKRAVRADSVAATRAGLGLAVLTTAGFLATTACAYVKADFTPVESAYASGFLAVIGVEWVTAIILIGMLAIATLWAWLRPHDPRGDAVTHNVIPLSWFMAGSGSIALVVLYLTPRLW